MRRILIPTSAPIEMFSPDAIAEIHRGNGTNVNRVDSTIMAITTTIRNTKIVGIINAPFIIDAMDV
jgi:hypothetical protein